MDIKDLNGIGKTFAFIILVIILVLSVILGYCIAYNICNEKDDNIAEASSNSRFETIETRMITASASYTIVYDKQTKVIYSIDSTGKFTPLIDENGDPLIYNGE